MHDITERLDGFGYDCYLDSRAVDKSEPVGPSVYRVTGGCMGGVDPAVTGWANVVCAARKFPTAAGLLLELSTGLSPRSPLLGHCAVVRCLLVVHNIKVPRVRVHHACHIGAGHPGLALSLVVHRSRGLR